MIVKTNIIDLAVDVLLAYLIRIIYRDVLTESGQVGIQKLVVKNLCP